MKLYFTRHGKTEWNEQQRFQGMTGDSPLLDSSYQEVSLLAREIKDVPFEKIYASTSLRARNTAELIQQELTTSVTISYTDQLKELGLGELEGKLIAQMQGIYPTELKNMRYHLDKYNPSAFNGEPINKAVARAAMVVKQAIESGEGPYLFVGHGASLTATLQYLIGKPSSQWRAMGGLKNNSLTLLETNAQKNNLPYTLKVWNDTSFLN